MCHATIIHPNVPQIHPKMVLLKVNVGKNTGKLYYTRMSQEFSKWLLNGLQPTYKLDVLG